MELVELLQQILIDPSGAYEQFNNLSDQFKPLVDGIAKKLVDYYEEYADNSDRFCKARAQSFKKKYDAYCEVGFSEEQAMALVLNDKDMISKALKNANIVTKNIANNA